MRLNENAELHFIVHSIATATKTVHPKTARFHRLRLMSKLSMLECLRFMENTLGWQFVKRIHAFTEEQTGAVCTLLERNRLKYFDMKAKELKISVWTLFSIYTIHRDTKNIAKDSSTKQLKISKHMKLKITLWKVNCHDGILEQNETR